MADPVRLAVDRGRPTLVGYVAWQFYGTNWVAERKHHEITTSLRQQWEAGQDFAPADDSRMIGLRAPGVDGAEVAVSA